MSSTLHCTDHTRSTWLRSHCSFFPADIVSAVTHPTSARPPSAFIRCGFSAWAETNVVVEYQRRDRPLPPVPLLLRMVLRYLSLNSTSVPYPFRYQTSPLATKSPDVYDEAVSPESELFSGWNSVGTQVG